MVEDHADRFLERCFSEAERAYAGDGRRRFERLAARFAAKEATMKALGTGWRDGMAWTDIEVTRLPSGAPTLRLSGLAARLGADLGIEAWFVSLSHAEGVAIASVIAAGAGSPGTAG